MQDEELKESELATSDEGAAEEAEVAEATPEAEVTEVAEEAEVTSEPVEATPEVDEAATADTVDEGDAAEESDAEEEEEEESILAPAPDDGIARRWYAIHAHSGQEANVQMALRVQAEQMGLSNLIINIFVPMEEVAEYKSGEKKLSKRKFFPGYVLVQLPEHPEKHADLWHLIKDTPGVTGFIGSRTEPVPLEDAEVLGLVEEMRGERERPRQKVAFEVGERIKVTDGAFANFMGNIGEINEERGKLKVLIEIFERQTSVEVEFWQVEKL